MEIVKAKDGQIKEIREFIDSVFKKDRDDSFSFLTEQGKIYNNQFKDYCSSHYLAIENNEIIGVGANVLRKFTFEGKEHLVSLVGSVSVREDYRNRGVMKMIMEAIDKENINNNVSFSLLTGRRERYRHYGYEKGPYSHLYTIDEYNLKNVEDLASIEVYMMKEEDSDIAYDIYLTKTQFPLRSKEEFYLTLKTYDSTPYVIRKDNEIEGYLVYNRKTNTIVELVEKEEDIMVFIKKLLKTLNLSSLSIIVSPLNKIQNKVFSKKLDGVSLREDINLKVYDFITFLDLVFTSNSIEFDADTDLVFEIDGKRFEVDIEYPHVGVWKTHHKPDITISSTEIIPLLFSPLSHRNAAFLPLYFSIPYLDLI